MSSILERIALAKQEEVKQAKMKRPLADLTAPKQARRDFIKALRQAGTAVIAEIKRASPSKGLIRDPFDVETIAKAYAQGGARCLSVLTDIDYFLGHPSYLAKAKSVTDLPVLRKDFIVDSYQIQESLSLEADCILLIAAILDDQQLHDYCQQAAESGMAVLVESHTQAELERALRLPTPLMGINNRSLHDFSVSLQTTIELSRLIPSDRIIICESGIYSKADIQLMDDQGIRTFLIGESLMRAPDPGEALATLID